VAIGLIFASAIPAPMPEIDMTTRNKLMMAAAALGALALIAPWPRDAAGVATGFVSHILCSEVFVSGLDPDRVYIETVEAMPGVAMIGWALDYKVDGSRHEVTTTLLGFAKSRAIYRGRLGCIMQHGHERLDPPPPQLVEPQRVLLPEIADPNVAANIKLEQALDRAFAEPDRPPFRRTKAVVILKDGQIVGERYAPGYGIDTPILGFSATKSVTSALIGILVGQGKLSVNEPAPVAAWRNPDDPRHAITIDHLLRHTSGLAMGSSLNASLASAFGPVNHMKFAERDMAGFAERASLEATPGTAWNYHDGNTIILSRLIRDAAGGTAADVQRLAQRELFAPLGMRNVTLEFDATGTPEGSSQMLAPARDWARFGELYLNDGLAGGVRILPEGWVHYSASLTPGAWVGMGAGFWTNLGDSKGSRYRTGLGMPRDAFYASGVLGQYVIIIPSERIVIVRFGVSGNQYDIEGVSRLVADVVTATGRRD